MSHFSDSMEGISLDDAVNRIRRQTDGRILSAEEIDSEYRIRVLTGNGKVRRLRVDPATGEIIRRRR
ncbi:PepSY domain-containing protein [Thiolapillus sp.]